MTTHPAKPTTMPPATRTLDVERPENLRRFFAGKAESEPATAAACCPPAELATCCAPEEKASCCAPTATTCGCA